MLTPTEEARLRDAMCVDLLTATSDPGALSRARAADRAGLPAYDPVPLAEDLPPRTHPNRLVPRDLIGECALCGRVFVVHHVEHLYCSRECQNVVYYHRRRRGLVA